MGINKAMAKAREIAKTSYLSGTTNMAELAVRMNVPIQTLYRWRKNGFWDTLATETTNIEDQISMNAKKALNKGLEQFIIDPKNTDLKAIKELLKDYLKGQEPEKELNEYVIRFVSQTVEFMHEKGLHELAARFQEYTHELADWLRVKNNG